MLTLKGFTLIVSVLILLLLGLATKYASFYLLTIPIFTYLLLSLIISPEIGNEIKCERMIGSDIINEGEEYEIKLTIYNEEDSKIEKIIIEDKIPEEAKIVKGNNKSIFSLNPYERKEIKYTVRFNKIGNYTIGPTIVTIYDSFGIRRNNILYSSEKKIKTAPKVPLLHEIKLLYKHLKLWPGEILSKRQGTGNEFYGIIEYSEGEELRRINWKAYARTDKIMKNVYHYEVGTESVIVIDYRSINNLEKDGKRMLDEEIKLALLISYRMLRDRYRIGLLLIGDKIYRLKPSFGLKQFNRILSTVLEANPGMSIDIRLLKDYVPLLFPITVQILMITPATDEASIYAIIELVRKGYEVTAILPSHLEFIDFETIKNKEIVKKFLEIERESLIIKLSRYCNVIDWETNQPIDLVISKNVEAWKRYQRRI